MRLSSGQWNYEVKLSQKRLGTHLGRSRATAGGGAGPQIENHRCSHTKGVGKRQVTSQGQTGTHWSKNIHPHLTCQSGLMPSQTTPLGSPRSFHWQNYRSQGRGGDIKRQDRTGTQHQKPSGFSSAHHGASPGLMFRVSTGGWQAQWVITQTFRESDALRCPSSPKPHGSAFLTFVRPRITHATLCEAAHDTVCMRINLQGLGGEKKKSPFLHSALTVGRISVVVHAKLAA